MQTRETQDVVVIGGGAAGLSAALVLVRSRRRVLVVDDGTPRNRFAPHMHGVLSRDGLPPRELLELGRAEIAGYGGAFADTRAVAVTADDAGGRIGFRVELADGSAVHARRVLAASGLVDELPEVPGLAERWGTDVVQCPYCDGWEHRDERIVVLATGPGAVHQAQLLRQLSDDVVLLVHDAGPLDPDEVRGVLARGIRIVDARAARLIGDDRLRGIELDDGGVLPADVVFTGARLVGRDDPLAPLGAERGDGPHGDWLAVDAVGRTSVPGLWAAGNAAVPYALVPMAMGAGVSAATQLHAELVAEDVREAVEGD